MSVIVRTAPKLDKKKTFSAIDGSVPAARASPVSVEAALLPEIHGQQEPEAVSYSAASKIA
jgi:hypothetical protein